MSYSSLFSIAEERIPIIITSGNRYLHSYCVDSTWRVLEWDVTILQRLSTNLEIIFVEYIRINRLTDISHIRSSQGYS